MLTCFFYFLQHIIQDSRMIFNGLLDLVTENSTQQTHIRLVANDWLHTYMQDNLMVK